ncbi:MAG: GNAT family N-acetyltransferase [Pseudomonadota bacterium]
MSLEIQPIDSVSAKNCLSLNERFVEMLSPLSLEDFNDLVESSFYAKQINGGHAFLIAFSHEAEYASTHFHWFKERHNIFYYVDRIVVGPALQGQGVARALYDDLMDVCRRDLKVRHGAVDDAVMLCAEVNIVPPNPASHRFHEAYGFKPVAKGTYGPKQVQYYEAPL